MGLSAEQDRIVRNIIAIGKKRGATRKEIVSALETGSVESGFRNIRGAGADAISFGWRQETESSYPNVNRGDVKASINRYYDETARAGRGKGKTAGQLAQSVQRSAYPERYDERRGEALELWRKYGGKTKKGGGGGGGGAVETTKTVTDVIDQGTQDKFDSAGYEATRKKYVLGTFLQKRNPNNLLSKLGVVSDQAPDRKDFTTQVPYKTVAKSTVSESTGEPTGGESSTSEGSGKKPKGVVSRPYVQSASGNKIAAWIAVELDKARKLGWNGTVTSGYRSVEDQRRVCATGVKPCAAPGTSRHQGTEFPNGAVDVSNAAQLDRILRRMGSPLKYAGAKDPVHFSVPSGGSY